MKMICIENQNGYCKLTVGKAYEILNSTPRHYVVLNDSSIMQKYEKKKFMTTEQYNVIKDRETNPGHYYVPIEVNLNVKDHKVEMEILKMDEKFRGAGDLFKFIGKENSTGLTLISNYCPGLDKDGISLYGRKSNRDRQIPAIYFSSNSQAIYYAAKVNETINNFNAEIFNVKIIQLKIYEVEHTPGGKLYSFISDQNLNTEDTVICDTCKGLSYGIVKNIRTGIMIQNLKRCWSK